eukprot:CAMPEP_0197008596 /NCGR_PEP_ID=MMETSP1380-20130617/45997_1 /TAXON_ID=5936 /ORGANISM="Euplotes crassus, Strain CT5" /LENGTH=79 /DNA_ID=CAMNT_0042429273 /DNA_START=722 /DNA_END=958 /DNA_ORIENTATION=-
MRPTTKSKLLVHHVELQEEHTDQSVDHGYGPNRASIIHSTADKDLEEASKSIRIGQIKHSQAAVEKEQKQEIIELEEKK